MLNYPDIELPEVTSTYKKPAQLIYRSLHRYKYQVMKDISIDIEEPVERVLSSRNGWVTLFPVGHLHFKKGYCWDGPSGISVDTENFMRGSLVHDGMYQLLREGLLSEHWRLRADEILRRICREDGMSRFRSWYVYHAVRIFGGKHAQKPTYE